MLTETKSKGKSIAIPALKASEPTVDWMAALRSSLDHPEQCTLMTDQMEFLYHGE